MSADNAIFVQRRGRKYHVWEGTLSEPTPHIPGGRYHGVLKDDVTAQWYAWALSSNFAVLEYGIIRPENISALRSICQRIAANRYWFWHLWIVVRNWYRMYRKGGQNE